MLVRSVVIKASWYITDAKEIFFMSKPVEVSSTKWKSSKILRDAAQQSSR